MIRLTNFAIYFANLVRIPAGRHIVKTVFQNDGGGVAKGGTLTLCIDDKKVGEGKVPNTPPHSYSMDGMDSGMDLASTVSEAYPKGDANCFNGKLLKVEINVLK